MRSGNAAPATWTVDGNARLGAEHMISRRRFMARTTAAIDELVKQLALAPSERVDVQARGWLDTTGSAVVALAARRWSPHLLVVLAYIAVTRVLCAGVVGAAIAFVVVSSLLGKALGLTAASIRFEMLRHALSRRVRRLQAESHMSLGADAGLSYIGHGPYGGWTAVLTAGGLL
jgi:hypothetical protein